MKKKNLAQLEAKQIIKRDIQLEYIIAPDGLGYPSLSINMEDMATAKSLLIKAGYTEQHSKNMINNMLKDLKEGTERSINNFIAEKKRALN
jgi:signal transduction protein with GAF and PtsI domain